MNDKITAQQAAEQWGIALRRVQDYCKKGRIPGAERFGMNWMIPADASKPLDGRTRAGREAQYSARDKNLPMPRKTPFLHMTDLYNVPGCADEAIASLSDNREAQILFAAEIAYSRGEIHKVYESAQYLLEKHSGIYAVLSAGMLLGLCAIWNGDLAMWRKAKVHIAEAPIKTDAQRDVAIFSITALDGMLYDVTSFPEWFKMGCFEPLHRDSLPAAKVFYSRYLFSAAYGVATREVEIQGLSGMTLMRLLPGTIEPFISQAYADNTVITEIYLRLICAGAYRLADNEEQAIRHIDRAIALALPDKLYGILAMYCRTLNTLLEQRIKKMDSDAWLEIENLYKKYNEGWATLSGTVRGKVVLTSLAPKQREVAKLAAFGLKNEEIARKLHMSVSAVKQAVSRVSASTGLSREDFAAIL